MLLLSKLPIVIGSVFHLLYYSALALIWVSFSPQIAAKQAAAAATQTIAASQNAAVSNKNTAAHQQLVQSCKVNTAQPHDKWLLNSALWGTDEDHLL